MSPQYPVHKVIAGVLGVTALAAAPLCSATPWVRAESEHFVLYGDSGEKTASTYLNRLEQYRYLLSSFHGQTADADAETPKLTVYFLSSHAQLKQTWPDASEYVQGYFKNCQEDQAAVAIDQGDSLYQSHKVETQDENSSQTVLFHEYAHNFMFQVTTGPYPPWFVEGFAEYYSTAKFSDDEAVVGMAFSWRVQTLTLTAMAVKYEDVLRNSWRPARGDDSSATDAFYAQSWLLTHYLLSDPERRKKFGAYLKAYAKGDDPVMAFETIMGIPVKTLPKVLGTYLNGHLQATVYRVHDMPVPHIAVRALPASANKLLLWDAADRLCPARDTETALLDNIRTEAAKYPGDDFAQTALARAQVLIGDESEALPYLKAYTGAHPDDADGFFMLGQTWFLMTAHKHVVEGETPSSQMAHARAALGRSYTLDPLRPANLYYFSLAGRDQPDYPNDNVITAAMEAHDLAPSVDAYAVNAAVLLIRKNRMDEAKEMLYPLAGDPHNPGRAQRMQAVIAAIDAGKTASEVMAALMGHRPDSEGGKPAPGDHTSGNETQANPPEGK